MFARVAKEPAKENASPSAARRQDRAPRTDHAQKPDCLATEFEDRRPKRRPQWGFCKMPVFAPDEQAPSPSLNLQRKLATGAVNDPLEQEADRVAEQVMCMPALRAAPTSAPPQVSRKCSACEAEEEEKLQKKPSGTAEAATGEVPASVHEVLRSPGQPLDAATRAFFEPHFGRDFSQVRVHSDATAAESARAVHALAYTVGRDVAFASGRYQPGASTGRSLLAHELTHVEQQNGAQHLGATRVRTVSQPGAATVSAPALRRQPAAQSNATDTGYFTDAPVEALNCFQTFSGPSLNPILQGGTITVVEFGASRCGPCKEIVKIFNQICSKYKDAKTPIKYYSIDVEKPENQKFAEQYNATGSLPQFYIFLGREEKHHSAQNLGRKAYEQLFEKIIAEATARPPTGDTGQVGLSRGATALIFGAASLALAGGALGILAAAGTTVAAGAVAGILGGAFVAGGIFGFFEPFGLRTRTKAVGAPEADAIVRQRFGKNLPPAQGPLHNARIRPVPQATLLALQKCRLGEEPDPKTIGWTDQGDPKTPHVLVADKDCGGGRTLEHASYDTPVIYYATDKPDASILLHEGLHAYAHPTFGARAGNFLNEGAAEFFSRQLSEDVRLTPAGSYPSRVEAVKQLVNVIGEEALQKAYFLGDFSAADAVLGSCGLIAWAQYQQMGSEMRAAELLAGGKKDHCGEVQKTRYLSPEELRSGSAGKK